MAHTNITTRIMKSRITGLTEENNRLVALNAVLQEEIAELKGETPVQTPVNPAAFAALMDDMAAEDEANGIFDHLDPEERDYGLGGQEFVDPTSGKDTWNS